MLPLLIEQHKMDTGTTGRVNPLRVSFYRYYIKVHLFENMFSDVHHIQFGSSESRNCIQEPKG